MNYTIQMPTPAFPGTLGIDQSFNKIHLGKHIKKTRCSSNTQQAKAKDPEFKASLTIQQICDQLEFMRLSQKSKQKGKVQTKTNKQKVVEYGIACL